MAKCYIDELLYGEMLHRRVVIWRNVIWQDVTEPLFVNRNIVSCK